MNCDSLSGLTNAPSASVLGNRAVGVNALHYVYRKGSETGLSKFRTYGAALQQRARSVCNTAARSFQRCRSLKTEIFWPVTQQEVELPYRRFRTIYQSHLHGSRILDSVLGFLTLKMGPIGCPETSVRNYHYSLCNNPEERSSHLLHGGSFNLLKPTGYVVHQQV